MPSTYATSLATITIAVHDLREAVHFYTKVLGFELTKRRCGNGTRSAVLSAGPLSVVLVEGTDPESYFSRFISEFGPGVEHLTVGVYSLAGLAEALKAAGMTFNPVIHSPGLRLLFTSRHACSGMRFELIERTGDGPHGASMRQVVTQGPWQRRHGL
jgi:methylmalonyl-CoA/ethylmalonyl-CoA epimerase